MSEQGPYKFEDIQRYLQHNMTVQEMHAFEKAMMDDPFLADAIEGYKNSNHDISTRYLTQIERALTEGNRKARIVAMPIERNRWSQIAAIVLVIITGAAISYMLFNTERGKNLAQQTPVAKPVETRPANNANLPTSQAPSIESDLAKNQPASKPANSVFIRPNNSLPANRENQFETNKITEEQQASASLQAKDNASGPTALKAEESKETRPVASAAVPTISNNADEIAVAKKSMLQSPDTLTLAIRGRAAGVQLNKTAARQQYEFIGKVIDTSGAPVPYASVRNAKSNEVTSTDKQGNFTVKAPDQNVQVEVNSVGFSGAIAKLTSSAADNNIVLHQNNQSLNEVVVVGYGKKRVKRSEASIEPEGGWNNFEKYANAEISNFKDSTSNTYEGDVEIEFSTDKEGRPKNIDIQQQADKATIDKATQILKNGPSWKGKRRSKIKVTLHF